MYYYKSQDQQRGNYKSYIVLPDTIGGLNRTHAIMAINAANERVQSSVMSIAYRADRAQNQLADRRAKRVS